MKMNIFTDNSLVPGHRSSPGQPLVAGKSAVYLKDNRPSTVIQKKQTSDLNRRSGGEAIQKKAGNTGLPGRLKAGIENLSGYSMDDVKVHYNSAQPAQLSAHAFAQGTDIHIATGQEKHLPHEAWHVVQQKQGRVKPTMQMKGKVNVNDNAGLEKEADIMGNRARQLRARHAIIRSSPAITSYRVAQMNRLTDMGAWVLRGTGGIISGTVGAVSGAVTGTANALYTNRSVSGVARGLGHGIVEGYQRPGAAVMGLAEGTIRTTGAIAGAVAGGVSGAIGTRTLTGAVAGAREAAVEGFDNPLPAIKGAAAAAVVAGAVAATGGVGLLGGGLLAATGGAIGHAADQRVRGDLSLNDFYTLRQQPESTLLAITGAIKDENKGFNRNVRTIQGIVHVVADARIVRTICADTSQVRKKLVENPPLLGRFNFRSVSRLQNEKPVRKANRISGLLSQKHGSKRANEIMNALNGYVLHAIQPRNVLNASLKKSARVNSKDLEVNRFVVSAYQNLYPTENQNIAEMERIVTAQWRAIEGDEPTKVVSHRGDGATFDKMRDYSLPRDAHDLVYRHEDENSEASLRKTMAAWQQQRSRLSGIECDVHLSSDGVPIVTHTSHIMALIDQEARRPLRAGHGPHIGTILERAIPDRFMRLDHWLALLGQYVDQKVLENKTRAARSQPTDDRKVRVEIEMKHDVVMDTAAGWRTTNKVVSKFLKRAKNSHMIEIAMFNNTAAPPAASAAARPKTMLSHVVHGQGGAPEPTLNEVRYGMHQTGIKAHIEDGRLDGKIVTFAPGLDFPAHAAARQLHTVASLPAELDILVEQSIQSARHRRLLELIAERKRNHNAGPVSVHTLTDHGAEGAATILNLGGLAVGGADLRVLDTYTAAHIIATHGMLGRDDIIQAIEYASNNRDAALIGRRLIERHPTLL